MNENTHGASFYGLSIALLAATFAAALDLQAAPQANYDPLQAGNKPIETIELTAGDAERSREIPLLVYAPKSNGKLPVIIHSHGLGGTNKTSAYLGKHWAARGYVAVFVQHPGSDDSVWRNIPAARRMAELRKAASGENLILRVHDIPAVIDQLQAWNSDAEHALHDRLDLEHIGMSGHSFGAVTTQYVSGQTALGAARYADKRIDAAIPMSPSSPRGGNPDRAFGSITVPWLCMTGTHDTSVIGNADVESPVAVYPALPAGNKYELVLFEAEHSVFTERALPRDAKRRNPNHHRVILALTTAFWDTYLRNDASAKAWLDGEGPRTILEADDRWQRK